MAQGFRWSAFCREFPGRRNVWRVRHVYRASENLWFPGVAGDFNFMPWAAWHGNIHCRIQDQGSWYSQGNGSKFLEHNIPFVKGIFEADVDCFPVCNTCGFWAGQISRRSGILSCNDLSVGYSSRVVDHVCAWRWYNGLADAEGGGYESGGD